ncbi:MAG: hypothetical protein P8K80_11130 [Phycisphaerales bacterium]|nr:hypothetical protein [Phycisphaerales bacterium]
MATRRRHPAHRFIALLTAAVMPLCCCMVSAASGAACCGSAPVVQAPASCCSSSCCQAAEEESTEDSNSCGDSNCSCCLKAPSTGTNWSPPIDTIGTPLPPFALVDMFDTTVGLGAVGQYGGTDPPPKPCDPDQLRGHVILQV